MSERPGLPRPVRGVVAGAVGVVVVTAVLAPFHEHLTRAAPALVLVLPVLGAALLGGLVASLVVAVAAAAAFSLAFIPPFGTLRIDVPEDLVAFVVFVLVAILAGSLVAREADRRRDAEQRRAEIERMHVEYRRLVEEREQLAVEARRAELLDHVDRQRAALLRSVSHDLRTPLATIRAVATDLRNDPGYDEATRAGLLDLVSDETERLDRIVANVLSLSRIEAGAFIPSFGSVDVAELVTHTAHRLERLYLDRRLCLDLADDLPLVAADYSQIDQVVTNLLENAVRHTPPGTTVTVRARRGDGPSVAVVVSDDGPGIGPELRDSLFEPFRSADRATTGIGLAICSAIVEAHTGTITAGDSPSGGASFGFTLPTAG